MKTTPFDFAFYYPATILMKGAREPKEVFIRDVVQIEIPTATVGEAPLAVDIEQQEGGISWEQKRLGFNGGLYQQITDDVQIGERVLEAQASLQFCADSPETTQQVFRNRHGDQPLWKKIKGQVFGAFPTRVQLLVSSDRDRIVDEMGRIAANMLLVDGDLYLRTDCPLIEIHFNVNRDTGYGSIRGGNSEHPKFSPARSDEAEKFLTELAPDTDRPPKFVVHTFREDLVGPLFEADLNAMAVVAAIKIKMANCVDRLTPEAFETIGRISRFAKAAEHHETGAADAIASELVSMRGEGNWFVSIKETKYWNQEKAQKENDELMDVIDYGLEALLRSPGVILAADQDASLSAL